MKRTVSDHRRKMTGVRPPGQIQQAIDEARKHASLAARNSVDFDFHFVAETQSTSLSEPQSQSQSQSYSQSQSQSQSQNSMAVFDFEDEPTQVDVGIPSAYLKPTTYTPLRRDPFTGGAIVTTTTADSVLAELAQMQKQMNPNEPKGESTPLPVFSESVKKQIEESSKKEAKEDRDESDKAPMIEKTDDDDDEVDDDGVILIDGVKPSDISDDEDEIPSSFVVGYESEASSHTGSEKEAENENDQSSEGNSDGVELVGGTFHGDSVEEEEAKESEMQVSSLWLLSEKEKDDEDEIEANANDEGRSKSRGKAKSESLADDVSHALIEMGYDEGRVSEAALSVVSSSSSKRKRISFDSAVAKAIEQLNARSRKEEQEKSDHDLAAKLAREEEVLPLPKTRRARSRKGLNT